jgi:predicted nucleic acid-binding Zn ribbon protein
MPTYEYEVIEPDGSPGERFEVEQPMADPPLTVHPETGQPVRRVITAPRIGGRHSDAALNRTLKDDRKLGELGFTKYVKTDEGRYEKRAGEGPGEISRS